MPIIGVVESKNAGGENRGPLSVGVIGWPIGHTVSPAMHHAAARAAGIDLAYGTFEVHPDNLRTAIEGVRALGLAGVNVTVPHKVAVTDFLDEIEPEARKIGAVNCIVNRGGTLRGHNFDAAGFARSLQVVLPGWEPARALVLGAGGGARAVVFALVGSGVDVVVWSRSDSRAQGLEADFGSGPGGSVQAVGRDRIEDEASGVGLVVNCTPVGMEGGPSGDPPVDCLNLLKSCVVYDLVYNPPETPLLKEARKAGLRGVNGLRMLSEQAALSFELWTGRRADQAVMELAALAVLGSNE